MAKRKLTLEQVREQIEAKVMALLAELDDDVAETYEISCWDSCLDGKVWNGALKAVTDMYVGAIVSDRDWTGKAKEYTQAIDISSALERMQVEREIRHLERKLRAMA